MLNDFPIPEAADIDSTLQYRSARGWYIGEHPLMNSDHSPGERVQIPFRGKVIHRHRRGKRRSEHLGPFLEAIDARGWCGQEAVVHIISPDNFIDYRRVVVVEDLVKEGHG